MIKRNSGKLLIFFTVLICAGCICTNVLGGGSEESEAINTPTFTPKSPPIVSVGTEEIPATTEPPAAGAPPDRCPYFENKEVKYVFHTLVEGDESMTMYVHMEGGWPGTELVMPGDPGPYEFHATLGRLESIHCNFLEYPYRLYCTFPLSKLYYNTAQVFKLYVLGCPIPIVEHPYLSIMVETLPPSAPPKPEPTMPPECAICKPPPP
jgi:hypothetical protein